MADQSGVQPLQFSCEGGLVLNQSAFTLQPGMALELVNFESDINGGYRRINGFAKWNTTLVPQTNSSSEPVLMAASYGLTEVIAARGERVYRSTNKTDKLNGAINNSVTTITVDATSGFTTTGTLLIGTEQITYTGVTTTTFTGCSRGANNTTAASHSDDAVVSQTWTSIDTGRTNATKFSFKRYNFTGTDKLLWTDGANRASFYDGSSVTDITHSSAPSAPSIAEVFQNHVFLSGDSSNPNEVFFSAPYLETDFSAASGAGSIAIDDTVVALKVFRDQLYIFGREKIFKLLGNTVADFQLQPVTRDLGCSSKHSVQELGGDIIFLAPDGLRTIAGTDKIGDVELGTISKPVQIKFDGLTSFDQIESVVVPTKTQYRIFFVNETDSVANTTGIIASLTQNGFVFSELKGIKPACTDYDNERQPQTVLHGSFDGYVYLQESGNTFDGVAINGRYRSPDLTMGDAGIRKDMQRIIINYAPEAAINASLFLRYDYESSDSTNPAQYILNASDVLALYGVNTYGGTGTYGGQRTPLLRQPVEGSGFAVALRINDTAASAPYSLKGFQLEFGVGARR
jgi:hypothetical protein